MAKALSPEAQAARDAATKLRALANLYDRRASQQELADNLLTYGAQLEEVRANIVRLDKEIATLERDSFIDVHAGIVKRGA